jgi:hypothetical protein
VTPDQIALLVQVAAVVAAVGASIVALIISALDRRNARKIAAKDRKDSLRQAQLLFEQEVLLRLLQNARRAGSTDPLERDQLGAEAAALIGLLGPERLPMNWENRVGKNQSEDEMRAFVADASKQEFLRRAVEVQLALNTTTAQIRAILNDEAGQS